MVQIGVAMGVHTVRRMNTHYALYDSSSLASIEQDRDKSLWNRMIIRRSFPIGKLRRIDKKTSAIATLSCFMYHKSAPLLLSTGHILLDNPSVLTSPFRSPSDFEFEVTYFSGGFT